MTGYPTVEKLRSWGFNVKDHLQWGSSKEALYQQRRTTHPVKLPVPYAFSHISVTVDDGTLTGDFYHDMQELERIGFQRFQSGISYNWAIDMATGMIGEGQYLDAKGTHTVNDKNVPGFPNNLNYYGHAIVAIGMPGDLPSEDFIASFAGILAAEQATGQMAGNAPIYPHSYFAAKDCPTEAVRSRLPEIRRLVPSIGITTGDLTMADAQAIFNRLETLIKAEEARYARYEAIHKETMQALSVLPAKIAAAIKTAP